MIPIVPGPGAVNAAAVDGFIDVLAADDLPPGSQRSVALGWQRVLLCHTPAGIHAVTDLCPHALQPLAGSEIKDGAIRCAKHGALFDLVTGKPKNGVTDRTLGVYAVKIRGGRVAIAVAPN